MRISLTFSVLLISLLNIGCDSPVEKTWSHPGGTWVGVLRDELTLNASYNNMPLAPATAPVNEHPYILSQAGGEFTVNLTYDEFTGKLSMPVHGVFEVFEGTHGELYLPEVGWPAPEDFPNCHGRVSYVLTFDFDEGFSKLEISHRTIVKHVPDENTPDACNDYYRFVQSSLRNGSVLEGLDLIWVYLNQYGLVPVESFETFTSYSYALAYDVWRPE